MTSLHQKWSPKASSYVGKENDGGVAACLNWSYGRARKAASDDQTVNKAAVDFQDAVDRVLNDKNREKTIENAYNKENAERLEKEMEEKFTLERTERPVLSQRENQEHENQERYVNQSRYESRPASSVDFEIIRTERPWSRQQMVTPLPAPQEPVQQNDHRKPTPGKCHHTHAQDRAEAWVDRGVVEAHPPKQKNVRVNGKTEEKIPLEGTKKFLKKYFNRPLNDDELRKILRETHRRISEDILKSELNGADMQTTGQSLKPGVMTSKSCLLHNRNGQTQPNGLMRITGSQRQNGQLQVANYEKQRPSSAQYESRDNRITWDRNVRSRPNSAVLPVKNGNRELQERGRHFSSWRPKTELVNQPWTRNPNNYDNLWQVRKKKHDSPKQLGAGRYKPDHLTAERDYMQIRPSSQQGKVNLSLDCPHDSDVTVSLRVQKSRASTRY